MPIRSLTAFRRCCLQPRYLSVVCTETCPNRNWIWSSSPPASRHRRAHVRRRSCGASFSMAALLAQSFTTCHTTRSVTPSPQVLTPLAANATKHAAFTQSCGRKPSVNGTFNPVRYGHRPNMSGFADHINDRPVILPALKVGDIQFCGLFPAQPATQKERKECSVSLSLQRVGVGHLTEHPRLFGG